MSTTAHPKNAGIPASQPDSDKVVPTPSQAILIIFAWLRHYWKIPRPKSKMVEIIGALAAIALVFITAFYTHYASIQADQAIKSADAAKSAANTARDTLVLAERPWIKIKHRIVKPLTFNVPGNGGLIDSMTVEDTLENVGTSVALNVLSWEDVIPIDADNSLSTALHRQKEWCDANRHPNEKGLSGNMIFPKDPFIQNMTVGGYMKNVTPVAEANKVVPGQVGFVLVGCVCYRSSFEPKSDPTHQTRFVYYLGKVQQFGIMPYVLPEGIASDLQLIEMPDGFSAD